MAIITLDPPVQVYDASGLNPGDVIRLSTGTFTQLEISNAQGAPGNPITIINHGGLVQVTAPVTWLQLMNCNHVKVTGTGDGAITYGIKLNTNTVLYAADESENLEIERVESVKGRFDIGDDTHSAFTMHNIVIHDCWFHDFVGNDVGIYIGRAEWTPGEYECENIEIYDNLFQDMGCKSVKVCRCTSGCSVHDNYIDTAGTGTGINGQIHISNGTIGECYNNVILDTVTPGIYDQGPHPNVVPSRRIYNNLLINTGQATGDEDPDAILSDSNDSWIYHNTIIGAIRNGIRFCDPGQSGHKAYNNIVLTTTGASINDDAGTGDIGDNDTKEEGHTEANYNFVNAGGRDYHLTAGSPGVDAGRNSGLPFDLDYMARPSGGGYDIGCYELQAAVAVVMVYITVTVVVG